MVIHIFSAKICYFVYYSRFAAYLSKADNIMKFINTLHILISQSVCCHINTYNNIYNKKSLNFIVDYLTIKCYNILEVFTSVVSLQRTIMI